MAAYDGRMRWSRVWPAVASALAGCYAPTPAPGAPCDPTSDNCPSGQTCQPSGGGFVCAAPGTLVEDARLDGPVVDAPTDTPADSPPVNLDGDGDGVPDTTDNCPAIANADQYNEDGDRFGDVCDPCPPIADDNPADTDGDGVANACDPRPAIGGDAIVLFEGFTGGLPATWIKLGSWTATGGKASIAASGGKANLTFPAPITGHHTIRAGVRVDNLPSGSDAAIGVLTTYDHTARTGLYCHLTQWTAEKAVVLNAVASSGNVLDSTTYEMTAGAAYVLDLRRDATNYGCTGTRGTTSATAAGASPVTASTSETGLRVVRADATFAWVMVVSNN